MIYEYYISCKTIDNLNSISILYKYQKVTWKFYKNRTYKNSQFVSDNKKVL